MSTLLLLTSCVNTASNLDQLEREEYRTSIRKDLVLNNGQRWEVDTLTRQNALELKSLLQQANASNLPSVAILLRAKTDELVRECRMESVGHEVLHAWLETFLEDQKLVSNPELQPEKVLEFLRADLAEFDRFFQ